MYGIDWEGNNVAEAKFKVGDRVKSTTVDDAGIGNIISVNRNGTYQVYFEKYRECCEREDKIELAPATPKFTVGDRVRVIGGDYADKVFQITDVDDDMGLTYYWVLPHGYCFQEARLELALDCAERKVEQGGEEQPRAEDVILYYTKPQPAIVTRIGAGEIGVGHVHPTIESATAEAERLARANPGQEFVVYQRVAGRVAQVEMKEVA